MEEFKKHEVNPNSKAPVIKDMFLFSIYAGKRSYLNKMQIEEFKKHEVNPNSKAPVIKDMYIASIITYKRMTDRNICAYTSKHFL